MPPATDRTLQWFRCDAQQQGCVARTGQVEASSLSYTVKPADVNGRLVAQQVAQGVRSGPPQIINTATAVVAAIPPSATPVISGIAQVGSAAQGLGGLPQRHQSVGGGETMAALRGERQLLRLDPERDR